MTRILPLIISIFLSVQLLGQSDLIISEYVEGWGTNKAIEVYNPTSNAINLSGYQLVRYGNGEDVPPAEDDWTVTLPDVELAPYKSYVCVLDKRDPNGTGQNAPVWEQLADRADVFLCPNYGVSNTLYHNGNDAIALETTNGTLVDLFGRWGAPAPAAAPLPGSDRTAEGWTDTAPYFTGVGLCITADHTLVRKAAISSGVTVNPSMFNPLEQWDSLSANTFNHLGWHQSDVAPANETPVFESDEYVFKITTKSSDGAVLGTIKANDAENDDLRYFINAGNFIYNSEDERFTPFTLNRESGEITLIDAASLSESQSDTLYIEVSVNDGFSESESISVLAVLNDWEVSKKELDSKVEVYPNPVKDGTISVNANKNITQIKVLDLSGRVARSINTEGKTVRIPVQNLSKGMYLLDINFDDQSGMTKRFIKE